MIYEIPELSALIKVHDLENGGLVLTRQYLQLLNSILKLFFTFFPKRKKRWKIALNIKHPISGILTTFDNAHLKDVL